MKTKGKKKNQWPRWTRTVNPFPLHAVATDQHDFGQILTPKQMEEKFPSGVPFEAIRSAVEKTMPVLVGSGPHQNGPHMMTFHALEFGIKRLRDFALAGDKAAMRCLGSLLWDGVSDLCEIARRHPELVRPWSRECNVVPVLTGKNLGHKKELKVMLDAFAVGEASPCRVNPPLRRRGPDVTNLANRIAASLCGYLNDYRDSSGVPLMPSCERVRMISRLPPLSKATWKKWADAGWESILHVTGGKPEEDEDLKDLGVKATHKAGLQSQKTKASNMRAEIHQTLREAIYALARGSPALYSE